MNTELHKPLGTSPNRQSSRRGLKQAGGAIILLALGAGIGFFLWGNAPVEVAVKTSAENNEVAADQSEATKKTPVTTQGDAPKARPDLPIDDNAPGLEEIKPTAHVAIPEPRPQFTRAKTTLAHLPDPELIEKYGNGYLPKISRDGLRPLDFYSRQPDTEGNFGVARLVLVVGGLGISQTTTQDAIEKLPAGVTLAFAASGNSLKRWTRVARNSGHELLLQIPMEPFGAGQTQAGANTLMTNLDEATNQKLLFNSLSRMTNYVGVLNYLGGKFLSTPHNLQPVLEEISDRGLLFVEDGTIKTSKAGETSKKLQLPYISAHSVIDAVRTRASITTRLNELESQAKRTGLAIGVATAFPQTIEAMTKFLRTAKQRGLEITPISAIVIKR